MGLEDCSKDEYLPHKCEEQSSGLHGTYVSGIPAHLSLQRSAGREKRKLALAGSLGQLNCQAPGSVRNSASANKVEKN